MFTPITNPQTQYYDEQETLWRAYVKRCCDRNDLSFITFAEWLCMPDSGVEYLEDDEMNEAIALHSSYGL